MICKGIFIGKVVFVETKEVNDQTTLQVTLNVSTGEKKKEGDQYPPSILVQLTLWGKYADAMEPYVIKGARLYAEGKIGVPYSYEKDGVIKTIVKLHRADEVKVLSEVESMEEEDDTPPARKPAASSTQKTTKKKPVEDFEDLDDINFED